MANLHGTKPTSIACENARVVVFFVRRSCIALPCTRACMRDRVQKPNAKDVTR